MLDIKPRSRIMSDDGEITWGRLKSMGAV